MQDKIIDVMRGVFTGCDITPATSQANCEKWDSMGHLNLIVALEDAFDTDLEPEEIAEMTDVAAIIRILKTKVG